MRCAHGAGFLYALGTHLNITTPDMVVGSSGNAGNLLYYATRKQQQYDEALRVWTELLCTPKFISYLRFRRDMDIDYLIDTVFREQAPFDTASLQDSPIEYYISVVDAEDGTIRFISRKDDVDPFEILRATMALPLLYGKTVPLLGRKYLDGTVGESLQSQVDFALSKGATKILFIDNSSSRPMFIRLLVRLYALWCPKGLREALVRDTWTDRSLIVPTGVDLLYVSRKKLPTTLASRDRKKLRETFDDGVADAVRLKKELAALFSA
ncbi:MAG: patatin-like phospholipase family protein [Patescibacteria group bacterium]